MNTLVGWLGQNTITVAVMIPIVLLACRLFRHRPAVQHALWVIVLVKLATPPVVCWPWTVEQLRASYWPADVTSSPFAPVDCQAHRVVVVCASPKPQATAAPGRVFPAPPAGGVPARMAEAGTDALLGPPSARGLEWRSVALVVASLTWVAGAVVCLAWQLRRIRRLRSLVRRGQPATGPLMAEVEAVARVIGVRPPRALISADVPSPFVWSLGRPWLVWPACLSSRDDVFRSRGVIAHELAHLRRGDHWVAWLELATELAWWWSPLFWFVRRRLRDTAEMACDALAIGTDPASRGTYAALLLQHAAGLLPPGGAPVLAIGTRTRSSFERRLSMILSDRVSGRLSVWGVATAVGLAALGLPGWSAGQPESASPALRPTPPITVSPAAPAPAAGPEVPEFLVLGPPSPPARTGFVSRETVIQLPFDNIAIAPDPGLIKLIEQGKLHEAKARLDELLDGRTALEDWLWSNGGAVPDKWNEARARGLPAACFKGLSQNALLTWKSCRNCHQGASRAPVPQPPTAARRAPVPLPRLAPEPNQATPVDGRPVPVPAPPLGEREEDVSRNLVELTRGLARSSRPDAESVDLLYRAVLARKPTPTESEFCVNYLATMAKNREQGLMNLLVLLSPRHGPANSRTGTAN